MAKTIKFNLICDGEPIRTLEDLRNNFSVEDVLSYFQNGLLKRWLRVRGFVNELKEVSAITSKDEIEIITELVKIFGITSDMANIEKDTFIFKYTRNHQAWLRKYKEVGDNQALIIKHYHEGFDALIDEILDNRDNMPLIKAALQKIEENYYDLFYLNFVILLRIFKRKAPMALLAAYMRPNMRKLCLRSNASAMVRRNPVNPQNNWAVDELDIVVNFDDEKNLKQILGDNLKEFAGETSGYWKDIEPKGKQCMILRIENRNFVRPAGVTGEEYGISDINGKFIILDGIDYKSNSNTDKLLYLEV